MKAFFMTYLQASLYSLQLAGLFHLTAPADLPADPLLITGHIVFSICALKVPSSMAWSLLNARLLPKLSRANIPDIKHISFLSPAFNAKDFLLNHIGYQSLFVPLWYAYFQRQCPPAGGSLKEDAPGLAKSRVQISMVSIFLTL